MLRFPGNSAAIYYFKFQVRRFNSPKFDIKEISGNFNDWRRYVEMLRSNKPAHQDKISRLSLFYDNLTDEEILKGNHLDNIIYFTSMFNKNIPEKYLTLAMKHVDKVGDCGVRLLAEKLLRLNRWPSAEKLIELKFKRNDFDFEFMKFKVLALNGDNFGKMMTQLSHLAKCNTIPPQVLFILMSLLGSRDGRDFNKIFQTLNDDDLMSDQRNVSALLNVGLKGKILSSQPPTLETFLCQVDILSSRITIEPSLLILGFTRCAGISEISSFSSESLRQLKSIYKRIPRSQLIQIAVKLQSKKRKNFPDEIMTCLLEMIYENRTELAGEINVLLGWIIKFCPENYSYEVLMSEYSESINEEIAETALTTHGLQNENAMKFIEFCVLEKGIGINGEILRDAIEIAHENFGYEASETFLKHIHRIGYKLSSKYYLRQLKNITSNPNLQRGFKCFRSISADSLHGDFLQQYLKLSKELLLMSVKEGNLDYCYHIYRSTSKYEILSNLNRPKSFEEFVLEKYSNGEFLQPFKPTINMECIRAAVKCVQHQKSSEEMLNDKFCVISLQAALTECDFYTANQLRIYMSNQGYGDGGVPFCQNVLKQWCRKIQ